MIFSVENERKEKKWKETKHLELAANACNAFSATNNDQENN